MARQQFRVDTEVSGRKVGLSFLVGAAIGLGMVYPTLPSGVRVVRLDPQSFAVGPVAGPLLIGVALFAFFILGMFLLNLLFMESSR